MLSSLALCAFYSQTIVVPPPPVPKTPDREVVVEAGKFDRENTVVRVDLLARDGKKKLTLRDDKGRVVPFQIDERGRAAFVVNLKAGARALFRLTEDAKPPAPPRNRVTVDVKDPNVFRVAVDGRRALELQGALSPPRSDIAENMLRAGFIHPVYSPAGAMLTDAYPQEQLRHVGIWSFLKVIEAQGHKVDFWTKPGDAGRIQIESKGPSWSGPIHGGFESRQMYTGHKPFPSTTLAHEAWRVLVYAGAPARSRYFVFDVESELSAARNIPVHIPKSDAGGLAVRGRLAWTKAADGPTRVTSDGPKATSARWAYVGGTENGKVAGIAMLSHPGNLGAPQALVPGDVPQQPFLHFTPNKQDVVRLDPHAPLVSRYRFVALDGKPDEKLLERLWSDFAFPPSVTVQVAEPRPAKTTASKQ